MLKIFKENMESPWNRRFLIISLLIISAGILGMKQCYKVQEEQYRISNIQKPVAEDSETICFQYHADREVKYSLFQKDNKEYIVSLIDASKSI